MTKGSINVRLAEKTGFSDEDAEKIHEVLKSLFEDDASFVRPEGSSKCRGKTKRQSCLSKKFFKL